MEEGPGISGMLGMSLWYAAGLAEPFPAGLCVFVSCLVFVSCVFVCLCVCVFVCVFVFAVCWG